MKKPLTLILLLAFIIPQITLAAWYNPLDWSVWNIFKKRDTQTEILQKKVNELETRLNNRPDIIPESTSTNPSLTASKKNTSDRTSKPTTKVVPPITLPTNDSTLSKDLLEYRNNVIIEYANQIAELDKTIKIRQIISGGIEAKINNTNDKIYTSQGYKYGDPSSAEYVDYFISQFQTQLKGDTAYLENNKKFISNIQNWKTSLESNIKTIKDITSKSDLETIMNELQKGKDDLAKNNSVMENWSNESYKLEKKIEGMMASYGNKYTVTQQANVQTPSYVTPVNTRVKCVSSVNFLKEVVTTCN